MKVTVSVSGIPVGVTMGEFSGGFKIPGSKPSVSYLTMDGAR